MEIPKDRIEILDPDLLITFQDKLKFIDYWKQALNIPIGWHYDLDFIWILRHIQQLKLPKDALIMDAGAGNGLLQFMLAALGYNIVSVDFAKRDVPSAAKRIFTLKLKQEKVAISPHRYQSFIQLSSRTKGTFNRMLRGAREPSLVIRYLENHFRPYISMPYWRELLSKNNKNYGTITYTYADFSNIPFFKNEMFDCIVSVSAIEHCDHDHIKKAVCEFKRVLKPQASMFITTSAASDKDWYFKPCEGWCFSFESLKDIFDLKECETNFEEYNKLFERLRNSALIKSRISKIYFKSGDNGLPWGIYDPKYQPVGIIKKVS